MFDSLKASLSEALRPILPLPMWQKMVVLASTFFVIVAAYLYMGFMPIQDEIAQQESQVKLEKVLLAKNQKLAQDIPRKQKEYAKLEKQLKVALNMLPKKSQIPDLLENVSWAGKDSGLEFSVFKPEREVAKQIYAEVPVALDVTGSFRQLLTFLKRVGEMPRIVDIKNLTLSQASNNALIVKGQAVTYRFVEEVPKSTRTTGRVR
ncbi:type IV pilus assembly protein PilO [Mariprofundus aestuarium]|uniref:Type IV pilus assembly protein PilO n=1 Tax=Mariprofundus aestuarium TaxID=1921086 RepID=A0A2K8KVW7_MARES|nr:type 4a pilus biogenesis protein PilO [Mariprofundus aestuarium]ATX78967.1 type IV pilus assembly protein PilO [Mariprofundus aestuarium]